MRILFFTALILACLQGIPAQAQNLNPDALKAQEYLRNLKTAKADFIQRSSLGHRLSGTFYLDRPGRLRFEYNEVKDFIVADGFFIYFYDAELEEQTNAPIGQTLADFLLRKDITFEDDLVVQETYSKDGFSFITLVQDDDPQAGNVQLIFSEIPYALRKWRVTDPQGETTEIELKNMERDMDLPNSLFGYLDPNRGKQRFND